MTEAQLEQWMRKEVEKRGAMFLKFRPTGVRGVPDRIVIWPEKTVIGKGLQPMVRHCRIDFIELKTETGALDPWQERMCKRMASYGCNVYVVRGRLAAEAYVAKFDSV